jgi:hypothetical protein
VKVVKFRDFPKFKEPYHSRTAGSELGFWGLGKEEQTMGRVL